MTDSRPRSFIVIPCTYGIFLGTVGFSCGFFGPMLLNPSANQGPMMGIFITGPVGILMGVILGLVVVIKEPNQSTVVTAPLIAALLWAIYILCRSLP